MLVVQRVNSERLVLLGWSRAILMQIAHPLIAAGVTQHSTFRGGVLDAAKRLHHTIAAMLSLTFGDDERRAAAVARIRGIHRSVNGALETAAGPFAAGSRYSAEDPALLLRALAPRNAIAGGDDLACEIENLEQRIEAAR